MIVQENISLKDFNTFGIDARAKYFASFATLAELEECLEFKKTSTLPAGIQASSISPSTFYLSPLVLGGGSNVLFTQDFDGLVLKNEMKGIERVAEDDDHVYVKAGAGENWHGFVQYCLANNFAGVENLSLIPGSVGASPMQNIGAYGVEIKDVFESLEAYHIHDKEIVSFSAADCAFGYRESIFKGKLKNQFVITQVTYRLRKQPLFNTAYGAIQQELETMGVKDLSIQAISQAVINIRSSKLPDPKVIGNAGSFFKNPEISADQFQELQQRFTGIVGYELPNGNIKLAAGWLIEQCGPVQGTSWKGYREGDAGCHAKQALVLVNHGQTTGAAIYELSNRIIASVEQKFGVVLSREVNVV